MDFGWGMGMKTKKEQFCDKGKKNDEYGVQEAKQRLFQGGRQHQLCQMLIGLRDEEWKWIIAFHNMRATGVLDRDSFSEIVSSKPN